MSHLTWTCHICGSERPDERISVHTRDVSSEHGFGVGTIKENTRYCNDSPTCSESAKVFRHFPRHFQRVESPIWAALPLTTIAGQTRTSRDPRTHLCVYDFSTYLGLVPGAWIEALHRYFNEGIETGAFLRAVLENDLIGALHRLAPPDVNNLVDLFRLLDMLREGAPEKAWGSANKVSKWLADWQPEGFYHFAIEASRAHEQRQDQATR